MYFVFFNLKLLNYPLFFRIEYFSTYEFSIIRFIILIIALLIMLIGLWDKCPIKFARKEFDKKDSTIYAPLIVLLFLIQLIPRLFFVQIR